MTTIPLSSLPTTNPEWRRDQWGRYLIVPPDRSKPVGYTRATTVAGTLDSGGGLAPWKATMAVGGVIMRRGLRAQWETLLAEHNGDPWYAGETAKAACKQLVEECASVGGANDRRDIGTSLHTLTALVDLGRTLQYLTEETEHDVSAYIMGLDAAGVRIVPEGIEQTVVLDEWQVAGTFDRLVTVPGFERPLIADLKTGADLSYSWHSIAVQLAIYSRGDALYRQGANRNGSEDVRTMMPDVDQDHGLVMWLNAGSGHLELFLVDLNAGWEAFTHSMWTRAWRTRRDVSSPFVAGPSPAEPFTTAHEDAEAITARRALLQERINVIGSKGDAARAELSRAWPPGVPSLRASTEHTTAQLDAITAALAAVEPLAIVLDMFPGSTITDNQQETNHQ